MLLRSGKLVPSGQKFTAMQDPTQTQGGNVTTTAGATSGGTSTLTQVQAPSQTLPPQHVSHSFSVLDHKFPFFKGDVSDLEVWFNNAESLARSKSSGNPSDALLINAAQNLIDHKDTQCLASHYATLEELHTRRTWDEYKDFWKLACSTKSRDDLFGLLLDSLNLEPYSNEASTAFNSRVDKVLNRFRSTLANSPWLDLAAHNAVTMQTLTTLLKYTIMSRNMSQETRQKVLNDRLTPATSMVNFISLVQSHGGFKDPVTVLSTSTSFDQGQGKRKRGKKAKNVSAPVSPQAQISSPSAPTKPVASPKPIVCHHCNQPGHKRPQCPAIQAQQAPQAQTGTGKYCAFHKTKTHDLSECIAFQTLTSTAQATGSTSSQSPKSVGNPKQPQNTGRP